MYLEKLTYLYELNRTFLQKMFKALKITQNPVSVIPSFFYLLFSFIFFHGVLHRRTWAHTPFKICFYREVGFQWIFFYLVRLWITCIRTIQLLISWFDNSLKILHSKNEALWLNSLHTRAMLLSIITCLSFIPFALVIATRMNQQEIPNFLMWVGEDPWIRSEIGISGHYLERPPNFIPPKRKEYAYRSRRSVSVEHAFYKTAEPPIRNCKSLELF